MIKIRNSGTLIVKQRHKSLVVFFFFLWGWMGGRLFHSFDGNLKNESIIMEVKETFNRMRQ